MKVIALAVVLTLVVGSQCATKCHWGPSYWCKNITTAEQCGRIQYCMDNVWKGDDASTKFLQKLKGSAVFNVGGMVCTGCGNVMQKVADIVTANMTQQLIERYFGVVCGLLPCSVGQVCSQAVGQIIPPLMDLISSGLAGKAVCAGIYLCPASDETCILCKTTVDMVKPMIVGAVTQIGALLGKVCTYLPSGITDQCTGIITAAVAQIIQLLDKIIDSQIMCTALHQCSKTPPAALLV